jgi:ferredoxin
MAYLILTDCINCDMCGPECPNNAISLQQQQNPDGAINGTMDSTLGKKIYQIDAALCTECVGFYDKPTCVEVCPIDVVVKLPNTSQCG